MLTGAGPANSILSDSSLGFSGVDTALEALERFVVQLQEGRQPADRCQTALTAICEGTGAQFAFVYADQAGRLLESFGNPAHPASWCRDLTHRLIAQIPGGGHWTSPPNDASAVDGGQPPMSVVAMPVDVPRPGWLVAVSFDPESPLLAAHSKVIRVIWRLQVGHTRHAIVYDNLKDTLFGVVRCLSTAIDAKDPYTCGHSERVARIAVRLGEEMGLARGEISDLYLAGLLHDVGKIGIRDDVLCKPGPLTDEEFAHIKEHPITGERIIANVTRLAYLRPGVRGHHERYDGRGYPDGLTGESIPLMARILAVADSCDAMMSARRYRPAIPQAKIEEIFRSDAGKQWDPKIVAHYFSCRRELYAVCQRGLGESVYMAIERAASGDSSSSNLPVSTPQSRPNATPVKAHA